MLVEVPESMLAERRRLGHDRFDEMWEGELHLVPPPSNEHQRIELELSFALRRVVAHTALELRLEIGLFDPSVVGTSSYRVPDVAVFAPRLGSERGIEGAATLVVEISSPGDESLEKVAFYSRVGVGELLIIDRDTKAVRRWSAATGDGLVEVPAGSLGWHHLDALPVGVRDEDAQLLVDDGEQIYRI